MVAEWFYRWGGDPAVVTDRFVAILRGPGAEEHARRVLAIVESDPGFEAVLDVLVEGGLSTAPSFFVGQILDGSLTGVVRGDLLVRVENELAIGRTFDGRTARTWLELAYDGVGRLWAGRPEEAPAEGAREGRRAEGEEREVRPGPLSVAGLVYRSRELSASPSFLDRAAPGGARARPASETTLAFDDSFPEDLFGEPRARPVAPDAGPEAPSPSLPGATAAPGAAPAAALPGYDDLFGSTAGDDVELAAVRDDPDSALARAGEPADPSSLVSAVVCPSGHPNPPERERCWQCDADLATGSVARVARPPLGSIELSDGRRLPLSEVILIGRNPRADRTDGAHIPTLVSVASPNHDVSRTHARVSLEGWQVLLEDLGSTNGTVLTTADGASHRIRPGQPAIVTDGASADLGDGVVVRFVGVP